MLLITLIFTLMITNEALYPKESETRDIRLLDGIWNFRVIGLDQNQEIGFIDKWYSKPLQETGNVIDMPVPSSYNDITQDRFIRDYAGWVWYDKSFYVSNSWTDKQVILRFGSAHYLAYVYVNGLNVVNHTGGHLPFETYVTKHLKYGENNFITVAVNNILSKITVPQGGVYYYNDPKKYPKGLYRTTTQFDFFNYAGIDRHVFLYALPKVHITDVWTSTEIKDPTTGVINYEISISDSKANIDYIVEVFGKKGNKVTTSKGVKGVITIPKATFWWPYTTNDNPGYQYTLKLSLQLNAKTIDVYYQKVGIRTVKVTDKQFLINDKPFYFRGFGKHEDANIRGKGLDYPILAKDFNLIKWIGANSFRTSHYPYSEELMDMADEQGIVVIDECPAVGLDTFNDTLFERHSQTIIEMILRDKNRPSVVMWSIANEPNSGDPKSADYFKKIRDFIRDRESGFRLPITGAISHGYSGDHMAPALDVIMVNRYWGWYQDTGYPQAIEKQLILDFNHWFETYKKPVMISEYGGDTVPGLHQDPPYVWSEDYQSELFKEAFKAFDALRANGFFVGELVWNFADFMTNEDTGRAVGNKKGIFTRERQPKASARVMRCRYWQLADTKKGQEDGFSYCI
ncbi:LOW QUALITY PROTEIN: beta-glucuronidase-like [Oppia nitens]|uniref:LOW QUALITY PROTEIN: beta-glucuronidase-like n=1 Tax=Oppia nitens TaxID=1686743 RepID=UPI0023DC922A|nr:LOW QUALITY PROTEIN: beta-glucuronidase-like [Oppia nitens]